ncbi:hypothetical protein EFB08_13480 [Rufibacter latericius]|uniref:Uncharacterized protein n=1 Tax=Rufibacter latericius TaxID=2487040 RepID=A0A3M9MJW9_9BACT|nr:hypothetical protein EFB08_13480 [Rufibacter latericius]
MFFDIVLKLKMKQVHLPALWIDPGYRLLQSLSPSESARPTTCSIPPDFRDLKKSVKILRCSLAGIRFGKDGTPRLAGNLYFCEMKMTAVLRLF